MSLIIREMQIKATMSYQLSRLRITVITKPQTTVSKDGVKKESLYTTGKNVNRCSYMANSMEIPPKTKNRTMI